VALLRTAVGLLAALAVLKLGSEFWRLLMDTSRLGAIDLKLRYVDVHRWFSGLPVYEELRTAVYPPASYAILWPLLGWLSTNATRWLWAVTSILALVWLTRRVLQASGATTPLERVFVALLPASMNATGVTIGNGQLILHCLPVLLAAFLLLQQGRPRWGVDALAAFLFTVALVKPNVSAPFFWAFLFLPGRLRPAVLAVGGYLALTLLAAFFQPADLGTLLVAWLRRSGDLAVSSGYGNLQIWFSIIGLPRCGLAASLVAIAALGVWTYSHRRSDLWVVLGVAALTARLSVYHLLYDDLLILLPMVALFRVSKRTAAGSGRGVVAGVLLAVTTTAMLAPARLSFENSPVRYVYTVGHALVWLSVLAFLLSEASRERRKAANHCAAPQPSSIA
jgi:hypothetical protein